MPKNSNFSLQGLIDDISVEKIKGLADFNPKDINESLKKKLNDFEDKKEQLKNKPLNNHNRVENIVHGSVQDDIPLKNFYKGMICTTDNRYLTVIEVFPINYYKIPNAKKERSLDSFTRCFVDAPVYQGLDILSDISNPQKVIEHMRETCVNSPNKKLRETLDDVINKITRLSSDGTTVKRYFWTIEYAGVIEGKRNNNIDEIAEYMSDLRIKYTSALEKCGNACYEPENYNTFLAEYLYYFFNRKTSRLESLNDRKRRIDEDYDKYNSVEGNRPKKPQAVDYISPKGLHFDSRNHIFMDGSYYTYLILDPQTYPDGFRGTWLDFLSYGPNVDLKILIKKLPSQTINVTLKQRNKITKQSIKENASSARGTQEKGERLLKKYNNTHAITTALSNGSDLFDVCIVMTIRAQTIQLLNKWKRIIKDDLHTRCGFKMNDCFQEPEEHFRLTSPFLFFTKQFYRNTHNFLQDNMATIYPFTHYSLYDSAGFVLGKATDYGSLAVINNFNTKKYANANIALFGSPGSGKTFTQMMIAENLALIGVRNFFIIPKKGYEYKGGCDAIGGTYVQLVPGSKDCVNICEIRPEGNINRALLDDDVVVESRNSLLAKKISDLCVWINLLCAADGLTPKEHQLLQVAIKNVYSRFGITEQNDTIYENIRTKKLKPMPIIEDIYNEVKNIPTLEKVSDALNIFIDGPCSNLNGQTNINIDTNYLVFDVDVDIIGDELLPSFLYIAFTHVYNTVKENPLSLDAVYLDEYWKMLATEDCAKQVDNFVRIIRGYGGAAILATQQIGDCTASKYGRSILNCTSIKFILQMQDSELKYIKDEVNLSEDELYQLTELYHEGMFLAHNEKVKIEVVSSDRELRAFNTDPTLRIKWAKEEEKKSKSSVQQNAKSI